MTLRGAYWVAVGLAVAVYLTMLFWTLPAISVGAGGLMPFDMRPTGYSGDEAREFLAALTDEARGLYQGPQHWLDLFYPALLAIVLIGAVRGLVPNRMVASTLILAALVGAASDYVENWHIAQMLAQTDPVDDDRVRAASLATQVKSAMTTLAMLGVAAGLLRAAWIRWIAR